MTGTKVRKAREKYTKQEWDRMTGMVTPVAITTELDTDEGMAFRDASIIEMAEDLAYSVPFAVRVFGEASAHEEGWAVDLLDEASEAFGFDAWVACRNISLACGVSGIHGKHVQREQTALKHVKVLYTYYLEDLFDDVVMAIEWQVAAMEDD